MGLVSHCPGVQLSLIWNVFGFFSFFGLILLDINLDLFLAFIGIITELFCVYLLRGDYSWNKCKRTVHFVVMIVIARDSLLVRDREKDF